MQKPGFKYVYLCNGAYCSKCKYYEEGICRKNNEKYINIEKCPIERFDYSEDWFPVLLPYADKKYGYVSYIVPFRMIVQHEQQCLINHGQTAKRLKERGGLSWDEMYAVINDLSWRELDEKFGKKPYEEYQGPLTIQALSWADEDMKNRGINNTTGEDKEFIVPVEWAVCGYVKVNAKSPEEAAQKLHKDNDGISVPEDPRMVYIDGSFGVSGYDNMEECVAMINAFTKDYNNGMDIKTLN